MSKVLIYKFHYDYLKNKYDNNSRLLFNDTDSLIYEIKTEDDYEDFNKDKEIFEFSNYSANSKHDDDSNKLVVGKMKDKAADVAIKEFVELKPKISQNEYKDVLLNNKCLRHLMSRIQSKNHRMGTYKINKIYLSCFDDKIYVLKNGYDGLIPGYQS